ncbi:MAG TPA: hypothetical protein VF668_07050, partial [Pyrinomonadaceae bacterium]
LTSSVSPEGGASSFAYDAAGDLTRRTDARHVRADYSYDALHRPVGRTYSVEPGHAPPPGYAAASPVAYFYDGRGMPSGGGAPAPAFSAGRLTAVKSSASETIYTEFDPAGRVKAHRQVADPGAASERAYLMEYGYDLAGNLTRQKYPSGKVVATEYDGTGRVAGVRDQAAGSYYAGGAAADPSGRVRYAAHGAAEAVRLGNGLWERASFNARLQTAEIALGSTPSDADRLRLSYGYGPAGNVTQDPAHAYAFDGENRLASVDGGWDGAAGVTFSYDGDGRRVRKASASEVTVFVYDCLGRLAAEYSNRVGRGGATAELEPLHVRPQQPAPPRRPVRPRRRAVHRVRRGGARGGRDGRLTGLTNTTL